MNTPQLHYVPFHRLPSALGPSILIATAWVVLWGIPLPAGALPAIQVGKDLRSPLTNIVVPAPTNSGPEPGMAGTSGAMYAGAKRVAAVTQSGPATYVPGTTLTITNTFSPGSKRLFGLLWKPQLPEGWTIVSVSGDGAPELVRGKILCVGTLPETSLKLVYKVQVPLTEKRACELGIVASYFESGMVNPAELKAEPLVIISPNAASRD